MRDPGSVQRGDLVPESAEQLVGDFVRLFERPDFGLLRHEDRVARGAERRRENVRHADAGAAGHERRERLVLDLLEPSDGDAVRRVPVGE